MHAVEGVGAKLPSNTDDPFNPLLFHRGMSDLQEYVLAIHNITPDRETRLELVDEDFSYEYDAEENVMTQPDDTPLGELFDIVPSEWDSTVVLDALSESYGGFACVVSRLSCGGGIDIWIKVELRGGYPEEVTIEFTDFARGEEAEMNTLHLKNIPARSSELAELMRVLSDHIHIGYIHSISTLTRAIDFSMTHRTPGDTRSPRSRLLDMGTSYWSDVRGTTVQNIHDNVSVAGDDLSKQGFDVHGDPLARRHHSDITPALEQLDPDDDQSGFVRLV